MLNSKALLIKSASHQRFGPFYLPRLRNTTAGASEPSDTAGSHMKLPRARATYLDLSPEDREEFRKWIAGVTPNAAVRSMWLAVCRTSKDILEEYLDGYKPSAITRTKRES